jgi:hypothetical protein
MAASVDPIAVAAGRGELSALPKFRNVNWPGVLKRRAFCWGHVCKTCKFHKKSLDT